jgi:anaphase-promoting complex subunit 6
MQHLQLNNLQLAEEYLLQAHGICDTDPLLLNELGVAAFERARYTEAVHFFNEAIRVAEKGEWDQHAWTVAYTNLGHAYRKMGYLSFVFDCAPCLLSLISFFLGFVCLTSPICLTASV